MARKGSVFDIPDKREVHIHGSSCTVFPLECLHEDGHPKKPKKTQYANTYQMEPPGIFRPHRVKPIIEKVLAGHLEGRQYDAIECSTLTSIIADEIKKQVKGLNFERYKIVALVTIGEKIDQCVLVGSRFMWDVERDNFASASWSNRHIYAVATVYAVYYE